MDQTLTQFIQALRNADVRISPAETLDAFEAVDLVGYRDREHLKRTLALVLPKTEDEKISYDQTFEQFFKIDDVSAGNPQPGDSDSEQSEDAEGGGDNQGGGGGENDETGQAEASETGKRKKKSKGKPKGGRDHIEGVDDEEEDLGPGETSPAQSELGKLVMSNSMVELTVAMAEGAREVKLEEIQVFTQKGLYTRRIMDAMGLEEMNREISGNRRSPNIPDRRLSQQLRDRREMLREHVRD